ncbi:hypothetical protein ElyMa_006487400 [Elysia marginata]|uniref:Uncharacterized protein n=1 Tax=Elysia marginata TaxID=1093978 RepID=A0AAV4I1Q2_9GAST|nr:hypothetical protein ElyMa_006487400 [Elysia marginata]
MVRDSQLVTYPETQNILQAGAASKENVADSSQTPNTQRLSAYSGCSKAESTHLQPTTAPTGRNNLKSSVMESGNINTHPACIQPESATLPPKFSRIEDRQITPGSTEFAKARFKENDKEATFLDSTKSEQNNYNSGSSKDVKQKCLEDLMQNETPVRTPSTSSDYLENKSVCTQTDDQHETSPGSSPNSGGSHLS